MARRAVRVAERDGTFAIGDPRRQFSFDGQGADDRPFTPTGQQVVPRALLLQPLEFRQPLLHTDRQRERATVVADGLPVSEVQALI